MPNTLSEQIHTCLAHVEDCVRNAAAQTNATLKQELVDIGWRWLALARSCSDRVHVEGVTKLISPTSSEDVHQNPATLTINIFQEEDRFGWTVRRRTTKEVLGRGVAQTELKARVDAFSAGMTFIERLTGQPGPADNSLH